MMKTVLIFLFLFCYTTFIAQDSIKPRWFNLGIQGALIVNNGLSNLYQNEAENKNGLIGDPYEIQRVQEGKLICFGFSGGVEAILGKSKVVKHLLGVSFENTNSEISSYKANTRYLGASGSTSTSIEDITIKRKVQFLVGSYGIKFNTKTINIGLIASFNQAIYRYDIVNGYTKNCWRCPSDSIPLVNVKRSYNVDTTRFVSLRIRLGHDFKIKNTTISPFIMRNLNVTNLFFPESAYIAPWWYLGVQYIPNLRRKGAN